jgi:flagellar basal-body rod modification protein FlgD
MSVDAVSANSKSNNASSNDSTSSAKDNSTLSQGDFLKLLVAQMTAQDPLNPTSNTEMAAQMAQFSALQTAQKTQVDIEGLSTTQQLQSASSLIGKTVMVEDSKGAIATGTVTGAQMNSDTAQILVNGTAYDLNQVLTVQNAGSN